MPRVSIERRLSRLLQPQSPTLKPKEESLHDDWELLTRGLIDQKKYYALSGPNEDSLITMLENALKSADSNTQKIAQRLLSEALATNDLPPSIRHSHGTLKSVSLVREILYDISQPVFADGSAFGFTVQSNGKTQNLNATRFYPSGTQTRLFEKELPKELSGFISSGQHSPDQGWFSLNIRPHGSRADLTVVLNSVSGKEIARIHAPKALANIWGKHITRNADTILHWDETRLVVTDIASGKTAEHEINVSFVLREKDDGTLMCLSDNRLVAIAPPFNKVKVLSQDGFTYPVGGNLDFSPDFKKVIYPPGQGADYRQQPTRIHDLDTGHEVDVERNDSIATHYADSVFAFSPNGRYIVCSGGGNENNRIVDAATGKVVVWLKDYAFSAARFSQDGRFLFLGSKYDGKHRQLALQFQS